MIIPSGFLQATLLFGGTQNPTGAAITLGFDYGTLATPVEFGAFIFEAFDTEILPYLAGSTDLIGCLVKLGPNSTGASGQYTDTSTGGGGSGAAAPNLAYLIQKQTLLGGREGRGRVYLPGVVETTVDGAGQLTSTIVGNLNNGFDAFLTALDAVELSPVLFHASSTSPTPVELMVCDSRAATQRRRLRR